MTTLHKFKKLVFQSGPILMAACIALIPHFTLAQVGGQVGGTHVIDDAEDLDLNAIGVNRDWISEFTFTEIALSAIDPATRSLTLTGDQSPMGVFRLRANNDAAGFFQKTAGIPVPGQKGESTLTSPGDMTSFEKLSFVACASPSVNNLQLQVILECYPQNQDSSFPKLYWTISPAIGTTFSPVELDLRSPDLVENAGGNSVEELLSRTRFLAFYLFAGPSMLVQETNLYFDDITLTATEPTSIGADWLLYD
jgi:hypothetical protein